MLARRLEAELLDTLPADDLHAIASRRDLVRINRVMRQGALMARQLRGFRPPRRLLDLGSGDGRFLLGVARRLGSRWAGVTAIVADQHDIVSDGTRHAFQHLGWRCEVRRGDMFDTLERLDGNGTLVTANLFLHHLDDQRLARLFALAASRAQGLVACEPRRDRFALAASRMVFALGCNHVTRHDAVASVRAGFTGRELATLWPDRTSGAWKKNRAFLSAIVSRRAVMLFDAAVVGAGPAGATAARLLAAAGWQVALIEKKAFPRRKVCGEFISAPTFPVLDACGIGGRFRELAGPPVRRIALFAGAARVTAPKPRGGETGWGRALGREHLDLLLRDAATQAGAILFQPADLTALEHNAQGHVCHLKCDGESATIAARTVIAATGSWRVKPPFAVRGGNAPSDLFAFKAHFITSALGEGVMPLLAFAGGYGGMVHTDNGRTSLSCCIRRGMLDSIRRRFGDQAGTSVLRHICETTLGVHDALAQAAPEGAVLSAGPIRPGMRPRYENGVFFCGNLAGEAHPIIAEGISMAIQSSWLLSRHLIAAGPRAARDRAGMAYARDWRRHFGLRLAAAWTFAHAAMDAPRLSTAMIRGIPALLTLGTELSGKLRPLPIDR